MNTSNVAHAEVLGGIEFQQATYAISQSGKSVTLTVKRSGTPVAAATVLYTTDNGTAESGRDYSSTHGQLVWKAGESATKSITVAIANAGASSTRTFSVALSLPSGAQVTLGTPHVATVDITTSSGAGQLSFASPSYSIATNGNALTVVVNRSGGSSGAVSVEHSTVNGTATAGTNYTATSGTLTWASGDTSSKSFSVPITDASFSGNKTFTVALTNAAGGATIGSPSSSSVSISGGSTSTPNPGPVTTPTPTGGIKSAVFENGKFVWGHDWNEIAFNYSYNAPGVSGSGPVIYMPGDMAWEFWLPYPPTNTAGPASNGVNFNLSGLSYFTIAIKPSQSGALADMQFYKAEGGTTDIPYGNMLNISQGKYGPAQMVAGEWNVYTIPLSDFAVSGWIYKFIIQQQGVTPQSWEIDQVGFK